MSDRWFEELADVTRDDPGGTPRAPARLKARVYSRLVQAQASRTRLLSLSEVRAGGERLCIFERAVAVMPVGERVKSMNPCRICHARVLAEHLDRAPIFWPGCPYSEFHND